MVLNDSGTWVLLRGLTRESSHWGRFQKTFETALSENQVVSIDIPGNGHLYQQQSPLTVNAMMESCREQLRAMGVKPPYQILGLSMGGMLALSWSSAYKDEVQACVLINTSMKPFSSFYERLQLPNIPTLISLLVRGARAEEWERAILRMTSAVSDESVLASWLDLRRRHPVSRVNAIRQLWAANQFRAPTIVPPAPTLVLTSLGDTLVSYTCSERIARYGQWPLRIHPSAGHDLPLDDPHWVIDQVKYWTDDLP